MNKQDWIEYFEALNGRTPSAEETAQALANGEFIDNAFAQATPTQEPVQPQAQAGQFQQQYQQVPPQQPFQQQFQQGQPQQGQAQFNQQQGQPIPPQQGYQAPAAPSPIAQFFKQFWPWLVSAWKSPTSVAPTHKYNGYFSFFLMTLFASLNVYIPITKVASGVNSWIGEFNSYVYNTGYAGGGADFTILLKIFFGLAFVFFAVVFAGFIVKNFIYNDKTMTFERAFEFYGRLFSVNTLLFAISALLSLLSIYGLTSIISFLNLVVMSTASAFSIADFQNTSNIDKFYKYLIAAIVYALIITLFVMIGASITGEMLFNSLIGF